MSTQQVIREIQSMPLRERLIIIEATLKLITKDIVLVETSEEVINLSDTLRQRRRNFRIEPFDLGEDVRVDRDLIYSERGI